LSNVSFEFKVSRNNLKLLWDMEIQKIDFYWKSTLLASDFKIKSLISMHVRVSRTYNTKIQKKRI